MSLTRFNDDPARIRKNIQESIYSGNYAISTPGIGLDIPFMEDPFIRLQGWGANLMTNARDVENELFGLGRPSGRHYATEQYEYKKNIKKNIITSYPTESSCVEQSRATNPAWMYKDQDHTRWENPFINPQANLEMPFINNIQTRTIEKDRFGFSFE